MDDLIKRLLDFDKMKYAADCKCGQCAIVPVAVCQEAAAALAEAQAEVARLREERAELAFAGRTLQGWSQQDVLVNSEGAYQAIKIIADRLAALAPPIADVERAGRWLPACECGMTGPCMWDQCKSPLLNTPRTETPE